MLLVIPPAVDPDHGPLTQQIPLPDEVVEPVLIFSRVDPLKQNELKIRWWVGPTIIHGNYWRPPPPPPAPTPPRG
ncbi:MAG: hypothetical protein AB1801_16835, partial [Chloroflexota bacterium]